MCSHFREMFFLYKSKMSSHSSHHSTPISHLLGAGVHVIGLKELPSSPVPFLQSSCIFCLLSCLQSFPASESFPVSQSSHARNKNNAHPARKTILFTVGIIFGWGFNNHKQYHIHLPYTFLIFFSRFCSAPRLGSGVHRRWDKQASFGKKRQPTGLCLEAYICKEWVSFS